MFIIIQIAAVAAAAFVANAPAPTAAPVAPLPKGVTIARLATPLARPADPVFDGRLWHCEGAVCRSGTAAVRAQSTAQECASLASRLGAFESYQTGADALGGEKLAKCNAGAKAR